MVQYLDPDKKLTIAIDGEFFVIVDTRTAFMNRVCIPIEEITNRLIQKQKGINIFDYATEKGLTYEMSNLFLRYVSKQIKAVS